MNTETRWDLTVRRNDDVWERPLRIIGPNLTGVDMRAQIRFAGDTPGAPLADLQLVTNGNAEGVRLASVTQQADGTWSNDVRIRLNKSTRQALPYSGEIGEAATLEWGFLIAGITRLEGKVFVPAQVYGSDSAPLDRPPSYGARASSAPSFSAGATLTISQDGGATLVIDGADLLGGEVLRAEAAADRAAADREAAAASAAVVGTMSLRLTDTAPAGFSGGFADSYGRYLGLFRYDGALVLSHVVAGKLTIGDARMQSGAATGYLYAWKDTSERIAVGIKTSGALAAPRLENVASINGKPWSEIAAPRASGTLPRPVLDAEINLFVLHGQSKPTGFDSKPALTTAPLYDGLRFADGVRPYDQTAPARTSLVPLIETEKDSFGETPASGMEVSGPHWVVRVIS